MDLTKEERDALPDSDFAVPEKRALPINDSVHVREAWDMVDRTEALTKKEKDSARKRILKRAGELGLDTKDWNKVEARIGLQALAVNIPDVPDHPNRIPFSGVLTYVDRPSDRAPGGSRGKRVVLSRAATERALSSLLGMGVDCTQGLDGHDPTSKIGIVTSAEIDSEDRVLIGGFFYGSDFPEEVSAIQANKADLGWSYEVLVSSMSQDGDHVRVDDFFFTGAAVLYKTAAAYHKTSLAAKSEESMADEKELQKKIDDLEKELKDLKKEREERKEKEDKDKKEKEKVEAAKEEHASRLRKIALDVAPWHMPHAEELGRIADELDGKEIKAQALSARADWEKDFYYKTSVVPDGYAGYKRDFNKVDHTLDQPGNPLDIGNSDGKGRFSAGIPSRRTVPATGEPSGKFSAGEMGVRDLDDYTEKAGMTPEQSVAYKLRYMRNIG